MEFKFKRKYTKFFIFALVLHALVLAFWLFFPNNILKNENGKQTLALLALANCELILFFYLGLYRRKFFAYYDKLVIKRSLLKTITIKYSDIIKIKEKENDTVFLFFGNTPSFSVYYKNKNGKKRKRVIRADNAKLLLKVIKNEIDIANLNNTNK